MNRPINLSLITYIAYIMFWVYFPGMFLYNFFVSTGAISAVLPGGGAGFVTALIIPFFFLQYLYSKKFRLVFGRLEIVFLSIIIFSSFLAFVYFSIGIPSKVTFEMFYRTTTSILVLFAYFLAAYSLNLESIFFSKLLIISFLVLSALIIYNVNWDYGLLSISANYANDFNVGKDTKIASYQFYARIFAPLSILVICLSKSMIRKIFFVILAMTCMVFIGSRTEMILMFVVFPFYYLITNITRLSKMISVFSVLIVSSLFVLIFLDEVLDLLTVNSRLSSLIDLSSDTSLSERDIALQFSIREIKESPFFGSYGSYASYESLGFYPHNILSAWHNYGILGFTQYVALFFIFIFITLKKSISRITDIYSYAGIVILLFSFMALLVAKESSYPLLGLGVGLLSRSKK